MLVAASRCHWALCAGLRLAGPAQRVCSLGLLQPGQGRHHVPAPTTLDRKSAAEQELLEIEAGKAGSEAAPAPEDRAAEAAGGGGAPAAGEGE